MSEQFILSCESTVDLPYAYVHGRGLPVLFYSYLAEEKLHVDDMLRDPAALPHFYAMLEGGALPSTSQLTTYDYEAFFSPLLEQGNLLHIAFGTGMTGSYY